MTRKHHTRAEEEHRSRARIAWASEHGFAPIDSLHFELREDSLPIRDLADIPGTRAWFLDEGSTDPNVLIQGKERR